MKQVLSIGKNVLDITTRILFPARFAMWTMTGFFLAYINSWLLLSLCLVFAIAVGCINGTGSGTDDG